MPDAGLISYGVDEVDSFRHAAIVVQKRLKGADSADLPLELPTTFELAINMKTAKALGIGARKTALSRRQGDRLDACCGGMSHVSPLLPGLCR